MRFTCFSPDGRYEQVFLTNWMKINMAEELSRVEGAGDCRIVGALDYAISVWVQPVKLGKYGLTIERAAAIQKRNSQYAPVRPCEIPVARETQLSRQIDSKDRLVDPEQFGNIIVRPANRARRRVSRTSLTSNSAARTTA